MEGKDLLSINKEKGTSRSQPLIEIKPSNDDVEGGRLRKRKSYKGYEELNASSNDESGNSTSKQMFARWNPQKSTRPVIAGTPLSVSSSHSVNVDRNELIRLPQKSVFSAWLVSIASDVPPKLWCNERAIYPKGYESRVVFFDILDPSKMNCYTSEILDGGPVGPVFRVKMDGHPKETFSAVSAEKCWQLVLDKYNRENVKQRRLGVRNLLPVLHQECIDGLHLFGLSDPKIVQVIEALDPNRRCLEYWNHRHGGHPDDFPNASSTLGNREDAGRFRFRATQPHVRANVELPKMGFTRQNPTTVNYAAQQENVQSVMARFCRKADLKELEMMSRILTNQPNNEWTVAFRTLLEEKRRRTGSIGVQSPFFLR